ncbi:hypothetical protein [Paenibacillus sp.]|jgi:hypothetical protein|uniref:hypothetical protein n=1 Tax=Paenibacillus sp. TaxID=58172 RepID=UPI00282C7C77|nr:hypothetical protein [Paenibacillus sp.]MDR0270296.1 hypothetical protein [Paenibacillus sp.]
MQISSELKHALQQVSGTLGKAGTCWLVGGSCGLLLQNVHLDAMPRDIDVYTDQTHMGELHRLVEQRSIDVPVLSETETYHSILSHYKFEGYMMELVGSFRVRTQGSSYEVMVDKLLQQRAKTADLQGAVIPLMPLSHELVFNVLRDRADRYEAIAKTMRADLPAHIPLLKKICETNSLSEQHIQRMVDLLGLNGFGKEASNLVLTRVARGALPE